MKKIFKPKIQSYFTSRLQQNLLEFMKFFVLLYKESRQQILYERAFFSNDLEIHSKYLYITNLVKSILEIARSLNIEIA